MDDILAGWLIARGGRSWVQLSLNFMEPPATTPAARCAVKGVGRSAGEAGYFALCHRMVEGEVPAPHKFSAVAVVRGAPRHSWRSFRCYGGARAFVPSSRRVPLMQELHVPYWQRQPNPTTTSHDAMRIAATNLPHPSVRPSSGTPCSHGQQPAHPSLECHRQSDHALGARQPGRRRADGPGEARCLFRPRPEHPGEVGTPLEFYSIYTQPLTRPALALPPSRPT